MVTDMASTQKVTVTLPADQVERVRRLVSSGQSTSVSGFVQHAVASALDDVTGWDAMLSEALEHTGGPLTTQERDWADGILGSGASPSSAVA